MAKCFHFSETGIPLRTLLLGDSLIKGLSRYSEVWNQFFGKEVINCGIGGDKVEHVLWRTENMNIPTNIKDTFILCGTNNIDRNTPEEIANGLICSAINIAKLFKHTKIYIIGLLPRDLQESTRRENIRKVNSLLQQNCTSLCFNQTI